jgi:uncharacterized membrane protein
MSYLGMAIGGIMIMIALPAMIINPLCLLAIFAGIFFIIASRTIRRRSREAADAFHRWQAFRHYLVDFSMLKEYPAPAIVMWEKYLVYAIVLGVADRVLAQLRQLAPQLAPEQSEMTAFSNWVSASDTASPLAGIEAVSHAMSSLSETLAIATSAPSSSSGSDGGFSGGGSSDSGGGGGGGGGSRGAD